LLLCLGVFVGLTYDHGGDLLAKAVRAEAARNIVTNEFTYSGYHFFYHHTASYFWLSDVELLSIREVRQGVYESARIHLASREISRSPGRLLLEPAQDKWDKTFYWNVSPDGKWILYVASTRTHLIYTAKSLDGSRQVAWTNRFQGGVNPTWLSDSSGFIEWPVDETGLHARVHWMASRETTEFSIDALPCASPAGLARLQHPFAQVPVRVQATLNMVGEFVQLRRAEGAWELTRFGLQKPQNLRRGEGWICLSPRGDRVAWLYYIPERVPQFTFERAYPFVETRPRYSTVVLISRPDGNQIHVVGSIGPARGLASVTWTPDGRRLSFVCDEALWTVPVD